MRLRKEVVELQLKDVQDVEESEDTLNHMVLTYVDSALEKLHQK